MLEYIKHYFKDYKPSQKLVILKMLQSQEIHDHELFDNFFI